MEIVVAIILRVVINGLLLWLAIMIADNGNSKNKPLPAIGWSFVIIGAFFWPLVGLIVGLVVLMMVLMNYYNMGFLRSILVIIVLFFLQLGLAVALVHLGLAEPPA